VYHVLLQTLLASRGSKSNRFLFTLVGAKKREKKESPAVAAYEALKWLYHLRSIRRVIPSVCAVVAELEAVLQPMHLATSTLAVRRAALSNFRSSLLGVATPLCSCSAMPLFIGWRL
jgi:hypothetical protein